MHLGAGFGVFVFLAIPQTVRIIQPYTDRAKPWPSLELCGAVEDELIWQGRRQLIYNNNGKILPPSRRIGLAHEGAAPKLQDFEVYIDAGVARKPV